LSKFCLNCFYELLVNNENESPVETISESITESPINRKKYFSKQSTVSYSSNPYNESDSSSSEMTANTYSITRDFYSKTHEIHYSMPKTHNKPIFDSTVLLQEVDSIIDNSFDRLKSTVDDMSSETLSYDSNH